MRKCRDIQSRCQHIRQPFLLEKCHTCVIVSFPVTNETRIVRDLHDTQPSRSYYRPTHYSEGLRAPPRILLWGVILFFLLFLLGIFGTIFGFREILQPAQQQRVIQQIPVMRIFLEPTPLGGVFPTIVSASNSEDAMALLEMPLVFASPTAAATVKQAAAVQPTATQTPIESTAAAPTQPVAAAPTQPKPTIFPATAGPVPTSEDSSSSEVSIPASARIYGIRHEQQRWNNCGPATITMALSYYGWQQDQSAAAAALKPNREDKNVSPHELANFVEDATAVKAIVRMGGNLDLLKLLVSQEFPVIIETGAMFEAYDWIGHYRTVVAYDDSFQLFYFFDSFLGVGDRAQGVTETYEKVDQDWQAFNRTFIVVYPPQQEGLLRRLLDSHWSEQDAAEIALQAAQEEARREPQNPFAWFNMGTSLVEMERYQEAATAFDQAQRFRLPWRMMWYQFGPFEAYFQTGRYDDVMSLVQINLNNAEEIEETYYWQGRVLEAQGKPEQATASFRRALRFNPNDEEARQALDKLNQSTG